MHIIYAAEDPPFQRAASNICLRAEDLIQVEGWNGLWRLPIQSNPALLQPEVIRFMKLYNKHKVHWANYTERAMLTRYKVSRNCPVGDEQRAAY